MALLEVSNLGIAFGGCKPFRSWTLKSKKAICMADRPQRRGQNHRVQYADRCV